MFFINATMVARISTIPKISKTGFSPDEELEPLGTKIPSILKQAKLKIISKKIITEATRLNIVLAMKDFFSFPSFY